MKTKKILKWLLLLSLTVGASLIVALLSFSGMYALSASIAWAAISGALAVVESEVYYQNIKNALRKLFKVDDPKYSLGKEYLRTHFPPNYPRPQFFRDYEERLQELHQFDHKIRTEAEEQRKQALDKDLSDMEKWFALQLFDITPETPNLSAYQQELQCWLKTYDRELWQGRLAEQRQEQTAQQPWVLLAGIGSLIATVFMCLGSSYLILEASATLPLMAAIPAIWLPFCIAPMALIAGIAYGLLTYNALRDMITQHTLENWLNKFTEYANKQWQDWRTHSISMAVVEITLLALIISLTLCTAGTWRTIAAQTPPLFAWMRKLPTVVMAWFTPIIASITKLIFNIQNTSETLEVIDKAIRITIHSMNTLPSENNHAKPALRGSYIWIESKKSLVYILDDGSIEPVPLDDLNRWNERRAQLFAKQKIAFVTWDDIADIITANGGHTPKSTVFSRWSQSFRDDYQAWQAIENPWHRWNPFRLFIYWTYEPTHLSVFLGHLSSDAVTDDRVAGIPEYASAGLGFICGGAVDAHYFVPDQHGSHDHSLEALLNARLNEKENHDHQNDIPTRLLKGLFYPIHVMADVWDYYSSDESQRPEFSLTNTWKKLMYGESIQNEPHGPHIRSDALFIPRNKLPADDIKYGWTLEHTIYRIEKYKKKNLQTAWFDQSSAQQKAKHLTQLQTELRGQKNSVKVVSNIKEMIRKHRETAENAAVYQQQRFFGVGKTATTQFLETELLDRVLPRH